MLRTALCCVLLAAATAMAWDQLDPVPFPADVEDGAHIVCGANYIWGVFPTTDEDASYAAKYGPLDAQAPEWYVFEDDDMYYMTNTSATFQWLEDGVFFVTGNEDGEDPVMIFYNLYDDDWDYIEDDLPFTFKAGACIAYQPNLNYNVQMNPVPGWIYCLPGDDNDFWRYAIPTSLPDVALDGIYPGQGAVIADQTPHFVWQNNGASEYRLVVSTNPNFPATGLDTVVSATQYEVTDPMDNGTYYWRTGTDDFGNWTWSSTHSFEIDGGWERLTDITYGVDEGAAMAYDGDYFGHQSILVLVGGGERNFYEYNIALNSWTRYEDAPKDVIAGTSLTTHDATEQPGIYLWAAFGGSGTSDNPWYYDIPHNPDWVEWIDQVAGSQFPQWLGPGASMAYGPNHYQYLIVGENAQGTPRSPAENPV